MQAVRSNFRLDITAHRCFGSRSENLGTDAKRRALNLSFLHNVDANQLHSSWTFWKGAENILVINNYAPHDYAFQKHGSQAGLVESRCCTCANGFMSLGQDPSAKFKLFRIVGVS